MEQQWLYYWYCILLFIQDILRINNNTPWRSVRFGSAPFFTSNTTISRCPCLHMVWMRTIQYHHTILYCRLSRPTIMTAEELSMPYWNMPYRMAHCSGVVTSSPPMASTMAPWVIKYLIVNEHTSSYNIYARAPRLTLTSRTQFPPRIYTHQPTSLSDLLNNGKSVVDRGPV